MDPVDVNVATACTLGATEARQRIQRWSELAHAAQLDAEVQPGRVQVRYTATEDNGAEIRALVELELACCAFLDYTVEEGPDAITLTVTAAPGAAPEVAADLGTLAAVVIR
jgi:hypothetical protein